MAAGAALIGSQGAGLTGAAAHVDEYIHPVAAFGAPDFRKPGGMLSFVTAIQKHGIPPQKMISIPTRMPTMVEKAGSLLWYIRMAWGRISPNTT